MDIDSHILKLLKRILCAENDTRFGELCCKHYLYYTEITMLEYYGYTGMDRNSTTEDNASPASGVKCTRILKYK